MATRTEIKVELIGVHLCCEGCVDAVDAALRSVAGVNSSCDMETGFVTLTASDVAAARKALNAFAAAGFHGVSNDNQLAMKAVSDIPSGKIKCLTVAGIHNCCEPCCEAIKEAIATVKGVTGDTAEPRATSFEVAGDFYAAALVRALNATGFSAKIKHCSGGGR